MPSSPRRPCATQGCSELVASGRCPQHQLLEPTRSHKGGYDWDWQKFRAWFLRQREHMICEDCQSAISVQVHHIRKMRECPELRLVESNCKGLCKACHDARTARGE